MIVTRGMGNNQMLVTRGYGSWVGGVVEAIYELVQLRSHITTLVQLTSKVFES